jgi:hypothetical protein
VWKTAIEKMSFSHSACCPVKIIQFDPLSWNEELLGFLRKLSGDTAIWLS